MAENHVDYGVVKKPQNDKPLTQREEDEWTKCSQDFWYFATNYCYVVGPKGKTLFEPRQYQIDMINVILNNRFTIINAPRQVGKRLDLDTVVPTPTGYTTIGQLKIGDKIIGNDGKQTNVTYLSPIEQYADSYTVKFSTGEEVLADAEHYWTVNHRDASDRKIIKSTLTTKEMLARGLYRGKPKPSGSRESRFSIDCVKAVEYEEKNLHIDPYILGYWLGDGRTNDSRIYVGINDIDHFTQYLNDSGYQFKIQLDYNSTTVYVVRINGLQSKLRSIGVLGKKHIPIEYQRASINQRIELLQGLMDSDGSIDERGAFEITFKSKILIDDTHELISSLGTRVSLPKEKISTQFDANGVSYYRITGKIYKSDYNLFKLPRKLDRMMTEPHPSRKNSTHIRQIVSIKKAPAMPMRCIQVDNDDHLFCVGRSYIVTHNTALMAVYSLWEITFTPDITSGVTSFKLTNVRDTLRRIKYTYENLPDYLKGCVTIYNASEVFFSHHAGVYGEVISDSALRGKTVSGTATVDEYAHCEAEVAEEFYTSFLPALEAAGDESTTKVVIISTPNSTTGKYAEIVNGAIDGSNGWVYHKVDPDLIPGRTEEWKEGMIRKIGINRYLQEFCGHFLSDNSSLINSMVLEGIKHKEPIKEIGDLKIFVESFKGRKLCIGIDVSEGVGRDNSSFQVFDIDSLEQVAEYANNMQNQNQYFKQILKFLHLLRDSGANIEESHIAVESNGLGNGILRLFEHCSDDIVYEFNMINDVNDQGAPTGKPGLTTTNKRKLEGCALLKELVEEEKLTLRSQSLLNELRMFTKRGTTFKAERGAKDDRVMATVICMLMLKQIANFEESIFDVINEVSMDGEDCYDIYW